MENTQTCCVDHALAGSLVVCILVLSGHFLFTYCDRFDYPFHREAVLELFRVSAKEVRIYPLQGPDAQPYEDLGRGSV